MRPKKAEEKKTIRCAIYTRKSTEEGLDQDFNSLDAQRESAEAFIKSQASEGWTPLPQPYDDGGFTGSNIERPALKRLLVDVEAGKVDCIVVYKVDRLSRSLLDFTRLMEVLDRNGCSFVSVTQQFNTTHSMGRLTLNILLSFAQFEREIIAERTKDKMSAARKKGKHIGGVPVLGYDLDPKCARLLVNEPEAEMVREIFALYIENPAMLAIVTELNFRGWRRKRWITKKGTESGGGTWDKGNLHRLLTNIIYTGRVKYENVIYPGEQPALVDQPVWEKAQALLHRNAKEGGVRVRNKHGALLRGLLHCPHCNHAMTHSWTKKSNDRCYRYYVCVQAIKKGYDSGPTGALPAGEIEKFVIERIRAIGRDPALTAEVLRQSYQQTVAGKERIAPEELRTALRQFDPAWDNLVSREQERLINLLVERVAYDAHAGTLAITFRPTGIKILGAEADQSPTAA
ncbi:MAG: recombinase family protein [Chthoniobacteraceae bacterium]